MRDDPTPTLTIQYLQHVAAQLRSVGVDVERWLGLNRLTEAQLDEGALAVTYPVLRQLVLDALSLSREPALGLFVGERLVTSTHGFVGYAAIHSGTLREVLEVFQRFMSLRTSLLVITSEARADVVRLQITEAAPLGEIQRPVLEAAVLSMKNVLDDVSMRACRVGEVAFPFPAPEYAALAEELFGCAVRYGQPWAGFTLPQEVMDTPLRMAHPEAFRDAARLCQRELDKLEAHTTLAARVRRLLLGRQNGFPSLQATARRLHMTPRTLHRHLVKEGTSYRDLLEDVRHTLAVDHLASGSASIQEIAYMLGYSDDANFRRAFRRWESTSPSAYRARHAADSP